MSQTLVERPTPVPASPIPHLNQDPHLNLQPDPIPQLPHINQLSVFYEGFPRSRPSHRPSSHPDALLLPHGPYYAQPPHVEDDYPRRHHPGEPLPMHFTARPRHISIDLSEHDPDMPPRRQHPRPRSMHAGPSRHANRDADADIEVIDVDMLDERDFPRRQGRQHDPHEQDDIQFIRHIPRRERHLEGLEVEDIRRRFEPRSEMPRLPSFRSLQRDTDELPPMRPHPPIHPIAHDIRSRIPSHPPLRAAPGVGILSPNGSRRRHTPADMDVNVSSPDEDVEPHPMRPRTNHAGSGRPGPSERSRRVGNGFHMLAPDDLEVEIRAQSSRHHHHHHHHHVDPAASSSRPRNRRRVEGIPPEVISVEDSESEGEVDRYQHRRHNHLDHPRPQPPQYDNIRHGSQNRTHQRRRAHVLDEDVEMNNMDSDFESLFGDEGRLLDHLQEIPRIRHRDEPREPRRFRERYIPPPPIPNRRDHPAALPNRNPPPPPSRRVTFAHNAYNHHHVANPAPAIYGHYLPPAEAHGGIPPLCPLPRALPQRPVLHHRERMHTHERPPPLRTHEEQPRRGRGMGLGGALITVNRQAAIEREIEGRRAEAPAAANHWTGLNFADYNFADYIPEFLPDLVRRWTGRGEEDRMPHIGAGGDFGAGGFWDMGVRGQPNHHIDRVLGLLEFAGEAPAGAGSRRRNRLPIPRMGRGPQRADAEEEYKKDFTHPGIAPPGFTFDFAPDSEKEKQVIVVEETCASSSAEGTGTSTTLVCVRCLDPLVMNTGGMGTEVEARLRIWGLRCGHLLDGKCVKELMVPKAESPAEDVIVVPGYGDKGKGKARAIEAEQEAIRAKLRRRKATEDEVSTPSAVVTIAPPGCVVGRGTPKGRGRKGVRKGRGVSTVQADAEHKWKCPINGCDHEHVSLLVGGTWQMDPEKGAVGVFV